jgi:ribonuclease T2
VRALHRLALGWPAALLLALAAPACAAYGPDGAGGFDYYVLALSWSPAFCASHPGDRPECGHRRGFVAHGLWPQYAGGGGPEHCGGADALDRETIERARLAMPDERLVRHEWVVHGTCSGLSPHDYFATLIHAIGRLAIPPEFDAQAARSLTPRQVVSAFVRDNPSLGPQSVAVRCRGPQLQEVRICLSRDLQPRPCGRDIHTQCRAGPVTIDAAR